MMCAEKSRIEFLHGLEDFYFVDELEARGYTITKNS